MAEKKSAGTILEASAELVGIQALLGHADLATTQIYTHVSEDRMAAVVATLDRTATLTPDSWRLLGIVLSPSDAFRSCRLSTGYSREQT